MDSAPATSDGDAAASTRFTSRLVQRATPVVRTPGRMLRAGGPGRLAGRFGDFGIRLGLSHTSRWALDAQRDAESGSTRSAPVRPPLNYWPWGDPDEPAEPAEPAAPPRSAPATTSPRQHKAPASTGDRKLDDLRRMLGLGPLTEKPAADADVPQPAGRRAATRRDRVVHRGLPRTLARRGGTSRGAPGDIAQRMRPQPVDPRTIGTREAAAPPPPRSSPAERSSDASDAATPSARGPAEPVARRAAVTASPAAAQNASSDDPLRQAPRPSAGVAPLSASPNAGSSSPAGGTDGRAARRGLARAPSAAAPAPSAPTRSRPDVVQRADNDNRADGSAPTRPDAARPPISVADDPPVARLSATPSATDARRSAPQEPPASAVARDLNRPAHHDPGPQGSPDPSRSVRRDPVPEIFRDLDPAYRGQVPRSANQSAGNAHLERVHGEDAGAPDTQGFRSTPTATIDVATRPPVFSTATHRTDPTSTRTTSTAATPTGAISTDHTSTAGRRTAAAPTSPAAVETVRRSPAGDVWFGEAQARANDAAPAVRRGVQPDAPSSIMAGIPATPGARGRADDETAPDARTTTARRPQTPAIRPPAAPGVAVPGDGARFDAGDAAVRSAAETNRSVDANTANGRGGRADPAINRSVDADAAAVGRVGEVDAAPVARHPVTPAVRPAVRRAGDISSSILGKAPGMPGVPTTARPRGRLPTALIAKPPSAVAPLITDSSARGVDGAAAVPAASDRRATSPPAQPMPASQRSAPSQTTPTSAADARVATTETHATEAAHAPTHAPTRTPAGRESATAVPPGTSHAAGHSPAAEPRVRRAAERRSPTHHQHVTRRFDGTVRRSSTVDLPHNRLVDRPADLDVRGLAAAPPQAAAAPLNRRAAADIPSAPDAGAVHGDPIRRDPMHGDPMHGDPMHGDTVRADGVRNARRRTAAEIAAPGADAAARFRSMLQRAPATTSPLPSRWRPLATAIVGDRPVRVSTGPATRAALQAAGKLAATSGNVVHLARPLRGAADAPLLAHELAHVANPSPEPRFFDDHRDSPEERRAELVADVIRRSPLLPRPSAGPTAPGSTIRRSPRTAPPLASLATGRAGGLSTMSAPATSASTTVSAAALAAQITGSSTRHVQREFATGGGTQQGPSGRTSDGRAPDVMRELSEQPSTGQMSFPSDARGTWPMLSRDLDSTSLTDFVDWIMEQLEDRIGRELERRGGRYRGEF